MSRDDALILDIVVAATDAQRFVIDLDWTAFSESRLHQNAVIRSLEIIGEASGRLSDSFRLEHSDIPWRDMVGMRHRLIHDYGDVRLDVVWSVLQDHLPLLLKTLTPLVPKE